MIQGFLDFRGAAFVNMLQLAHRRFDFINLDHFIDDVLEGISVIKVEV
jgi:hypothetical protein